jgi:hypothetical protein
LKENSDEIQSVNNSFIFYRQASKKKLARQLAKQEPPSSTDDDDSVMRAPTVPQLAAPSTSNGDSIRPATTYADIV